MFALRFEQKLDKNAFAAYLEAESLPKSTKKENYTAIMAKRVMVRWARNACVGRAALRLPA